MPNQGDSPWPNKRNPNDSLSAEQINELDEETAVRGSHYQRTFSETAVRGALHYHGLLCQKKKYLKKPCMCKLGTSSLTDADHNSDHDSASNGGDVTGMPSLI